MAFVIPAFAAIAGGIGSAAAGLGSALGLTTAAGTAASAAGTAAAASGTAAAAGGILGTGITATQLITGLGTAGSLLTGMAAARAQGASARASAASLDAQAWQAERERDQEEVAGLQRQSVAKRQLLAYLGQSDVAYAAAGIDISAGAAQESRQTAELRAVEEGALDLAAGDTRRALFDARAAMNRSMAARTRSAGRQAEQAGLFGALLSTGQSLAPGRRA